MQAHSKEQAAKSSDNSDPTCCLPCRFFHFVMSRLCHRLTLSSKGGRKLAISAFSSAETPRFRAKGRRTSAEGPGIRTATCPCASLPTCRPCVQMLAVWHQRVAEQGHTVYVHRNAGRGASIAAVGSAMRTHTEPAGKQYFVHKRPVYIDHEGSPGLRRGRLLSEIETLDCVRCRVMMDLPPFLRAL